MENNIEVDGEINLTFSILFNNLLSSHLKRKS